MVVQLWDLHSGRLVAKSKFYSDYEMGGLKFSPDGTRFSMSDCCNGKIYIFKIIPNPSD